MVEDERTINDALAQRLRAEGYARRAGLRRALRRRPRRVGPPDVVLLDVMLPGFDGHEVCRRIQAERPVPVLMLTARDDEADILVGLGVGADDYLTKPFSHARGGRPRRRPAAPRRARGRAGRRAARRARTLGGVRHRPRHPSYDGRRRGRCT